MYFPLYYKEDWRIIHTPEMWRLIHLSRVHPRMKCLSAVLYRNSCKHRSLTGNASRVVSSHTCLRFPGKVAIYDIFLHYRSGICWFHLRATRLFKKKIREPGEQRILFFVLFLLGHFAFWIQKDRLGSKGRTHPGQRQPTAFTPHSWDSSCPLGVVMVPRSLPTSVSSVQHSAWHNPGF